MYSNNPLLNHSEVVPGNCYACLDRLGNVNHHSHITEQLVPVILSKASNSRLRIGDESSPVISSFTFTVSCDCLRAVCILMSLVEALSVSLTQE